ncbi:MAG: hypothetical protein LBE71_05725 [Dysgonamonadaceae bacterium]|nr:hypothetical protein [Dysgonamonadaceae bacterium]
MKKNLIYILFLFIALSCKDGFYSTIPNAQVSYKLNLNIYPDDMQLNAGGTGVYLQITKKRLETDRLGYGGLLIVNGIGEDAVNIYAYDLACPNEVSRSALIVPENSSETGIPTAFTAKCPKCGAVYNITDGFGTPLSGSTYYLRTYRVIKISEKIFEVRN